MRHLATDEQSTPMHPTGVQRYMLLSEGNLIVIRVYVSPSLDLVHFDKELDEVADLLESSKPNLQ